MATCVQLSHHGRLLSADIWLALCAAWRFLFCLWGVSATSSTTAANTTFFLLWLHHLCSVSIASSTAFTFFFLWFCRFWFGSFAAVCRLFLPSLEYAGFSLTNRAVFLFNADLQKCSFPCSQVSMSNILRCTKRTFKIPHLPQRQ